MITLVDFIQQWQEKVFSKTITDEKGVVYELPVGEYYKSTNENN
jgi:hypothetical protein